MAQPAWLAALPRCTAKSKRSGERCQMQAMTGRNKCHIHGGKTPEKHLNHHQTPGSMYSKYFSEEDQAAANLAIDLLGSLDEEIKLCRVQMARVVREQRRFDQDVLTGGNGLQIDESTEKPSGLEIKRKRPDFHGLIQRYAATIHNLESKRKDLLAAQESITQIESGLGLFYQDDK